MKPTSIKLDGNERNSRVDLTENQADKLVHQFAENRNVYVEYAGSDGRYLQVLAVQAKSELGRARLLGFLDSRARMV